MYTWICVMDDCPIITDHMGNLLNIFLLFLCLFLLQFPSSYNPHRPVPYPIPPCRPHASIAPSKSPSTQPFQLINTANDFVFVI